MTRDEVLDAVELAACEHDAHAVGLRLVDKALAARWHECESEKLRAAAEIIRAGGWRPIAEVDAGEVIYAGKWNDRNEWQECWPIVADVAVSFGYTHHWPQMKKPEPPAREAGDGRA